MLLLVFIVHVLVVKPCLYEKSYTVLMER